MKPPVVGILGGLGPLAGAYFYRRLVEATPASSDDAHPAVLLISDPSIPSRAAHLLADGQSPVPVLRRVLRRLADAGATLAVIPSSTTHAYYEELAADSPVPIVNLLRALGNAVAAAGSRRPGLVATTASVKCHLFDGHMPTSAIPIYPDDDTQRRIQGVIDEVKAGTDLEAAKTTISELLARPCWAPADTFLFACTETPLLLPLEEIPLPILSATDVLVTAVLHTIQHSAAATAR